MKPFFRIEMLPAKQGDAIWVEYGNSKRTRRILIDAGPIDAYPEVEKKLMALPEGDKRVEAVIITHVDTDHIEGIIRLFAEKSGKWLILPEDIWFNGYAQLIKSGTLGGREGDFLSALLQHRDFNSWNKKFGSNTLVVLPNKDLPTTELEDGMKITLLSPDQAKLKKMAKKWLKDVDKHDLKAGDLEGAWEQFLDYSKLHPVNGILGGPGVIEENIRAQLKTDQSEANGSCIAFLAEFEGKRCLFLADAHHSVITSSIKKLIPPGETRLKVDAVKVSHHGSKNNISKALMDVIDAKHFLVSTNGAKFNHPDKPAITAIIQGSLQDPVLWFNYTSDDNKIWKPDLHPELRPYAANYPDEGEEGIALEL
jgi:hypothetical protein